MAIKRPDIYQHNNDKFAIVDSDYVRGGFRSVNNLNELYALYPNEDQLKQFVTQVYVINLSQFYLLVDKTKINGTVFLPEAWKLIESSGSGSTNLILSLTWEELITLKNASELIPGVTYKITDYKFISSNARLTASTKHIDILINATSVNTLDENVSFYSEDFNTSGWSGKYTIDDVDKFDYIDKSKKVISLDSITTVNKYPSSVVSSANSSTVLINILQNSSYTRESSPIAPVLSNSFPYSGIWDTISFQDGVFYVTGENQSRYLTSSDGINWSVNNILDSLFTPIVANWYKLIINNGIKYLFTKNSPYYYTESAGVWTRQSFPTLVDIAGVDVSTDIYVLPKTGKTLYKVISNGAIQITLNSEGTSWNSLSVNSGKLYLGGAISAEYVVSNGTLTNLPYFTNCLDLKAYNNIILGASTSGTLASINGVNYRLNTSYTSSAFITNFLSGYYIINGNQLNTLSIGEILNNCKGVIYELIDENDNKAPFDFKTMLIDGVPTFSQLNSNVDLSEISERCTNNHIVNSPYTFPFLKLRVSTPNDKLKHLTIVGVNGINNITAAQQQLSDTNQIPHFCINIGNDIIYYKFTDNLHIDAKIYNTGTWDTYDASYDSLITTKLFTLGESSQSVKSAIDYLYTNKADLIEGKVPSSQLPSYVSQVVEVADYASLPTPGISDTIYVTLDTDLTYRWGGTQYVEISPSLAIGELATTAYRGDRGKIAYDHSQSTGNPHQTQYSELVNTPTTLSGFGIETEVDTKISEGIGSKQDTLTAGNKIIIENNVISVEETGIDSLLIPILWNTLINHKESESLVPGALYRIIDYECIVDQENVQSAGHDFDIIVQALSTKDLSETASAVQRGGDTYFSNSNLKAWEIKYCINNDTSRFAWADIENGKGVIYYMKDEQGNECPYDFKNIQYLKNSVWLYTFGGTTDNSLTGGCHHNTMMDYISSSVLTLNFNTFGNYCNSNTFDYNCYRNTFGDSCNSNTFGNYCSDSTFGDSCNSNTFGDNCYSNTFGNNCGSNTFGNDCTSNTFGNTCYYNTFGNTCYHNTFGNNCYSNTFGDDCGSNTLGLDCNSNTFGSGCHSNTFGSSFSSNTFGNYCYSNNFGSESYFNTFGDYCYSNTFGNNYNSNTFGKDCVYNNFYAGASGTTKKDFIRFIVLEDGCRNNNFYSTLTTSGTSYLQRIRIKGLDNTTPTNTQITLSAVNTKYEWVICYTSGNVLKQYCPDNNDTYKLEDTDVLTTDWVVSNKYTGFGYQAQINIPNLTEDDFVNVVFKVNDAVSGNYAPAIEQYVGHILVFSKVNTAITIPTIAVTKIN